MGYVYYVSVIYLVSLKLFFNGNFNVFGDVWVFYCELYLFILNCDLNLY